MARSRGGDIRHRWAEEARAATANAPPALRRRVEAFRQLATARKLLLLECAILRHSPFSDDGRTIWQLLPTFEWFANVRGSKLNGHDAIEIVERLADDTASPAEVIDADEYFRRAEYAAEADRFGFDTQRAVGSELRYGVTDWLYSLGASNEDLAPRRERKNVLDYYATASASLRYYSWGGYQPFPPEHRAAALALIDDIFGDPLRPAIFSSDWRTDTAVAIAQQMYESRDFGAMPILADALQDAGCDSDDILNHCRAKGVHVRGCWVVDLVLGKR